MNHVNHNGRLIILVSESSKVLLLVEISDLNQIVLFWYNADVRELVAKVMPLSLSPIYHHSNNIPRREL